MRINVVDPDLRSVQAREDERNPSVIEDMGCCELVRIPSRSLTGKEINFSLVPHARGLESKREVNY